MGKITLFEKGMAEDVASFLLQTKSVTLSPEKPYTWSSGMLSPIYCDNRRLLSFPDVTCVLLDYMNLFISEKTQFNKHLEAIAGVAMGGVPLGTLLAAEQDLPFYFIRSNAKDHGKQNQVEGATELLDNHTPVLIIEDLISTGGSSKRAADAMKEFAPIAGMIAIFTYGFKKAEETFAEEDYDIYTLCDFDTLFKVAIESEYITSEEADLLGDWSKNPAAWSEIAKKRLGITD